jgi:flavin-dependent thymidylate synthase
MLADLKHSVPFESIVLRFWIKMPIQTDRQFMTHRLQSASGMSGRYRTMPSEYLETNDESDNIINKIQPMGHKDSLDIFHGYYETCENANSYYNKSLELAKKAEKDGKIDNVEYKRLREFIRGTLPQNNMTERVTVMNLRSFSNFIKLRNSEHAQPEIREVAKKMLQLVKESDTIPVAINALERNNWVI